jgi:hypothetical protein
MEQSDESTARGKIPGQGEQSSLVDRTKNIQSSPEMRAGRDCQNSPATFLYDAGGLTRAFSLRIQQTCYKLL